MPRSDDETGDDRGDGSCDAFLREAARIDSLADTAHVERAMGSRVGRFVLRDEVGRGGMGIVYRAHDDALGRSVALKVLPSHRESDPRRRARFLREARSAASIVHANVATVYEIGEADASLYIAMELVVGESLRARLAARRPLPTADVVRIAKGILRGLAAAHARGIVHRDLKPENVMLDANVEPKILDFGLAKLRDVRETPREILEQQPTEDGSTEEGRLLGTPAYMSPEQAKGGIVDARSDLFSLGVVLYEALTGGRPFVGATSFETLAAVVRDEPKPLRDVPPELAGIVMQCLAKAPDDRPGSASDLLDALERPGRQAAPPLRLRAMIVAGVSLVSVAALVVAARFGGSSTDIAAPPIPSAAPIALVTASSVASASPTTSTSAATSASSVASVANAVPSSSARAIGRLPSTAARPSPSKPPAPDPLGDQE